MSAMRNLATLAAFAASANALVPRQSGCCFSLSASGEASGSVGQLGDGQNRIGGDLPAGQFCINSDGSITDGSGRGCILTPPTTQFQCDLGGNPTPGFSVNSNGELEYNGSTDFVACETGEDDELNLYTTESSDVTNCRTVTLNADGCSGAGAGSNSSSVPGIPSSSAPMPSSTVPVVSPSPSAPGEGPGGGSSTVTVPVVSPSPSGPGGGDQGSGTCDDGCPDVTSTILTTITVPCVSGTPTVPVPIPGGSETPGVPPGSEPGPGPSQPPSSETPPTQPSGSPGPSGTTPSQPSESPSGPSSETTGSPGPSGTTPSQPSESPSGPSSATPTPQPSGGSCPTDLSGDYEYPHLIVPVDSSSPDVAAGTQLNGSVTSTVSTIFNFDIPATDAGKTCNLIFLFPRQEDLETSAYSFNGDGSVQFGALESPATQSTTYNNAPAVSQDYGEFTLSPGNSYPIASFDCPAGEKVGYEMTNAGSTDLEYFQDYNPSPLGLYITVC
ncbi:ubiquitin 3 binding protein But2 C-terminal domain-containing protein [Aspergillus cavernicola]|uniref:Ubiquitin 3 binding protein But2 C-terminal domain-containing protein n=1 Tax=Aspergillus cavernicola TaxID=176166 RepID=A0ABR4HTS8_9EURO